MERLLATLRGKRPSPATYDPVPGDSMGNSINSLNSVDPRSETPFSWFEYGIFTLLGIAMLWAWYDRSLVAPTMRLTPLGTCFSPLRPTFKDDSPSLSGC